MSKLLLTITTLLSLTAVFADLDDEINSQLSLLFEEPAPFNWVEPAWYPRYNTDGTVSRCHKRDSAPFEGQTCSRNAKTCYFGDQQCPDGLLHPVQKCHCPGSPGSMDGGNWDCTATNCPTCPAQEPASGETTCSGDLSCLYGEERCCGKVHSKVQCNCEDGVLMCLPIEACLLPECFFDDYHFLVGETCDFSVATIKDNHPAMNVVCAQQEPAGDFDTNRIVIVTDASNVVTAIPKLG